ncbi:DNA polymerase II [Algicola sagamiensis]|uniref:DNA polymerase II n=1 Tax=Algicola sagamiensis TaxID=163869 RepID=UPI0003794B9D|nr:DNA polymerase II [Algicola sagamiensis]
MEQVFPGFILSKQMIDTDHQMTLQLWLKTPQGPVLATSPANVTFFVSESQIDSAKACLRGLNINAAIQEHNPFQTFYASHDAIPVTFYRLQDYYRALRAFNAQQIMMFEQDIKPAEQFLMERYITASCWVKGEKAGDSFQQCQFQSGEYLPPLSVLSLDIETNFQNEVISIGFYNQDKSLVILRYESQPPGLADYVEIVPDEQTLLKQAVQTIQQWDPDVIIGWSVIDFDLNLLHQRCEFHQIPFLIGRGKSPCTTFPVRDAASNKKRMNESSCPGRLLLDGINCLKNAQYQFESYSLDAVSELILHDKKLVSGQQKHHQLMKLYHEQPGYFTTYNLKDCVLVWQIFQQLKLVEFEQVRSQLTGLAPGRGGGSVAAFTHLYLPRLHQKRYCAPSLGETDHREASPGGYVMTSKPGFYEKVWVFDFKSLYPSIIRTFLIDPYGLMEGGTATDDVPGFNGALFSRNNPILPTLIEQLWSAREQAKKEKNEALSQAVKIIMNSFYGVLGSHGCRFFDARLASSITKRGHWLLQQTSNWLEEMGYTVIYGDTDSVFIEVKDKDCDYQQRGKVLASELNKKWLKLLKTEFQLESALELEFERFYQPFFMPTIRGQDIGSKKRYVGRDFVSQKNIFKGMESVRSDWTGLAKEVQQHIYQMWFDGEDIQPYIMNIVEQVKQGKLDHLLVYSKRLRKPLDSYVKNTPPHVSAARKLKDLSGKEISKGSRISYMITTQGPEPIDGLTAPIDYEHYIEKQILPVIAPILDEMSIDPLQMLQPQISLL